MEVYFKPFYKARNRMTTECRRSVGAAGYDIIELSWSIDSLYFFFSNIGDSYIDSIETDLECIFTGVAPMD